MKKEQKEAKKESIKHKEQHEQKTMKYERRRTLGPCFWVWYSVNNSNMKTSMKHWEFFSDVLSFGDKLSQAKVSVFPLTERNSEPFGIKTH